MSDGTRIVLADPEGYLLEEIANTAITDRWSVSALEWIKSWVWKNSGVGE